MDNLSSKELSILKDILQTIKEDLEVKLYKDFKPVVLEENENKDAVDAANEQLQVAYQNRMRNREFLYLKKVKSALEKIKEGTYGLCRDCDGPISFTRLKARPTSDYCLVCKEEAEGLENQSLKIKPKSLGNTLAQTI